MGDVDLTLATEASGNAIVIRVSGNLDLSTVTSFDAECERTPAAVPHVIDLSDCTFIDSSALRALVRRRRRVADAGGQLALVAPSPTMQRVLEIAALDRFVPVFGALEDAVTSFS